MNQWTRSATEFGGHSLNSGYYRRVVRVEPRRKICTAFYKHWCLCKSDWRLLFYVLMGCAVAVIVIIATLLVMFFTGQVEQDGNSSNIATKANQKAKPMSVTKITDDNLFGIAARPQIRRTSNIDARMIARTAAVAATVSTLPVDHFFEAVTETSLKEEAFSAIGEAVPVSDTSEFRTGLLLTTTSSRIESDAGTLPPPPPVTDTDTLAPLPTVIDYAEEGSAVASISVPHDDVDNIESSVVDGSDANHDDHKGGSDNMASDHLTPFEESESQSSATSTVEWEAMSTLPNRFEMSDDETKTEEITEPTSLQSFDTIAMDNTGWNPLPDDSFFAWLTSGVPIGKHGNNWQRMDKHEGTDDGLQLPSTSSTSSAQVTETMATVYTGGEAADILVDKQFGIDSLSEFTVADDILSEFRQTSEGHSQATTTTTEVAIPHSVELQANFQLGPQSSKTTPMRSEQQRVHTAVATTEVPTPFETGFKLEENSQPESQSLKKTPSKSEQPVVSAEATTSTTEVPTPRSFETDNELNANSEPGSEHPKNSPTRPEQQMVDTTAAAAATIGATATEVSIPHFFETEIEQEENAQLGLQPLKNTLIRSEQATNRTAATIATDAPATGTFSAIPTPQSGITDVIPEEISQLGSQHPKKTAITSQQQWLEATEAKTATATSIGAAVATTGVATLFETNIELEENSQPGSEPSKSTAIRSKQQKVQAAATATIPEANSSENVNSSNLFPSVVRETSGIGSVQEVHLSGDDHHLTVDPTSPSDLSALLIASTAVKINVFASTGDELRPNANIGSTAMPLRRKQNSTSASLLSKGEESPKATKERGNETSTQATLAKKKSSTDVTDANGDGIKVGASVEVRENNRRLI